MADKFAQFNKLLYLCAQNFNKLDVLLTKIQYA